MGIPFYFTTLIKSHAGITRIVRELDVDILGIDFNCLIHRYLQDSNPIKSVLDALEHILKLYKAKTVIIALDGLVPYGKIVQQRYRRFKIKEPGLFDRNQISPDTPFMRSLESELRRRFPRVILSPTQEPGEGEHKIFQEIKKQEGRSICIYGLDADLILLSLFNHKLGDILLLRESGEFNDPKLKHAEFAVMDINKLLLSIPFEIEQYLALSVMCFGNDFMPNLGVFSLREDGYDRAIEYYTKSGKPDLREESGRAIFLDYSASREMDVLKERVRLRKQPFERAIVGRSGDCIPRKYGLHILGVFDMEPVVEAFWKTFHWTIHYFTTNEVLNWEWVYPYPDAPLLHDIVQFYETPCEKKELNFKIVNQLQFILPKESLKLANRRIKFVDECYSETREPWMKRHEWETKPRISLPWHPTCALTSVFLL